MSFCTNCGAQLGFGRFCTNCGAPIVDPTDPAPADPTETQVRLPAVQPDAAGAPRFPLYAEPTDLPAAPPPHTVAPGPPPTGVSRRRKTGPPILVWVLSLVLLAVLGGVGTWWLIRDNDDTNAADAPDPGASQNVRSDDPDPQPSPDQPPFDPTPADPGDAVDLTAEVAVQAPTPAPPGQAVDGSPVSYPPSNMLDRDPTTAYRITGNAAGEEIVFTLPEDAAIHEVGLINGYAKVDGRGANRNDWYASNRKILEVEWVFDDGTTIAQSLNRTTDMQVIAVDAAQTRTVRLRLVRVSKPGPNPRNTTAISSVRILGSR